MTQKRSKFKCPSCGQRLLIGPFGPVGKLMAIWCGHGPCQSKISNDGAFGETEREAFEALAKKMEEE